MAKSNCRQITRKKAGELQLNIPKEAFLAADNLTYAGFRMWMFLMIQPEEVNISVTYRLLEQYHIDTNTIKRGINDLIKKGYLVEVNNNVYDFYAEPQITTIIVKRLVSQF